MGNRSIFTHGSLQHFSQNHCTVVPEITAFLFAENTAFLFPVYKGNGSLSITRWFYRPQGLNTNISLGDMVAGSEKFQ